MSGLRHQIPAFALRVVAVCFVLLTVTQIGARIGHPFELEWLEGGMVHGAMRLAEGLPLYPAPTMEFIPFIYTPMYTWLGSLLLPFFENSFLPFRILSVVSTVVICVLLGLLVRREGGNRDSVLIAVALFLAAYQRSAGWYDVARCDMLFLAFLLGGIALVRPGASAVSMGGAGMLFLLAFLTKQTALPALLPLLAHIVWFRRAQALPVLLFPVGVVVAVVIGNHLTDGWFSFYVFQVPSGHPWIFERLLTFWSRDLARHGIVLMLLLWLLLDNLFNDTVRRENASWWIAVSLGLFGSSWLSRLHDGGHINVLVPCFAWLALAAGVVHGRLAALSEGRTVGGAAKVLGVVLIIQFALLVYPPWRLLPTKMSVEMGVEVVDKFRALEGPTVCLTQPYLLQMAGRPQNAHAMAIHDVLRGGNPAVAAELRDRLHGLISEASKGNLLIINDGIWFQKELESMLVPRRIASGLKQGPTPPSGMRSSPSMVWGSVK